jgi:TPR repeat protein
MKFKAILVVVLAIFFGSVAHAQDYGAGVAAAKRGDFITAVRNLKPLADSGDAFSQHALGTLYLRGEGVPKDERQAANWLQKAAQQGLPPAETLLAILHEEGRGVPKNIREAVKWYERAAMKNYAAAQVAMGYKYVLGEGIRQDYVLAHAWFNLAAASGSIDGRELREKIARQMTPSQLAEAQKRARSLQGKLDRSPSNWEKIMRNER